jgi:hypothetical protein
MPEKRSVQQEIEKVQHDALARLADLVRQGKLADQEYLLCQRRIVGLCLESLRLYAQARLQVQLFVAQSQSGKDAHFDPWLNDRAAVILRELEQNIFHVLQDAIRNARSDLPHSRPREKVMKEVIVKEVEPDWLTFVRKHEALLYVLALCVFGFFSSVVFGVLWLAIVLPIGWLVLFRKVRWLVLIPIGLLVLLWFYLTS